MVVEENVLILIDAAAGVSVYTLPDLRLVVKNTETLAALKPS